MRLLWVNPRIRVVLARRLRRETTMNLKWPAQELDVGSWIYLSNLLNQGPRSSTLPEFSR